jgi:RecA/RadA recombinase
VASSSTQPSAAARLAALDLPGTVHLGRTTLEPVRRLPSGLSALDVVLDGGWPRGRVSEIVGGRSSGKTSIVLASLAAATRRGEVVACIDVADALHPDSLQRAGVDLARLLWVRPPASAEAVRCAELILQAGGFGVVVLDFGDELPHRLRGHTWPRLARATEQARASCLVVAPRQLEGSGSALGLALRTRRVLWQPGIWSLLDGLDVDAQVVRNRLGGTGKSVQTVMSS